MNIAGMLMIICTSPGDAVWKCVWMMFRAGATAAPAITVRSDRDNIAVINLQRLCFLKMLYMSASILLKKKSASPFGLTLSQLNAVRLPQKTEKSQWHFSAKRYATLCQNCRVGPQPLAGRRLGDLSRRGTSRWKVPCQNVPALAG